MLHCGTFSKLRKLSCNLQCIMIAPVLSGSTFVFVSDDLMDITGFIDPSWTVSISFCSFSLAYNGEPYVIQLSCSKVDLFGHIF